MYYFRQVASSKLKHHETKGHDNYLTFISEPIDSAVSTDPMELDAMRFANRYLTKRVVRKNIRRLRKEFLAH